MTTLADQILLQMDVDALTRELQSRSRRRATVRQAISRERPPSSLASSIDILHEHDAGSDAPSSQYVMDHTQSEASPLLSTSGLQSWVESSGTPQSLTADFSTGSVPLADSIVTLGTSASGEDTSATDSLLVSSPIFRNKIWLTAMLIVRYWHEFVCSVRLEQYTN